MNTQTWGMLIYDPESYGEWAEQNEHFDLLRRKLMNYITISLIIPECNKYNKGDFLNAYVKYFRRDNHYDKCVLVYDGDWLWDGIANQAFYTISYNRENINHHTYSLIDEYVTPCTCKEKWIAFIAECLYKIYKRIEYDNKCEGEDLQEKRNLIDQLKNFF